MKNISFMQLVLGVGGAALIYSGIKDIDLKAFFSMLVKDPKQAFNQGFKNAPKTATPSSDTNPGTGATGSTPSNKPQSA